MSKPVEAERPSGGALNVVGVIGTLAGAAGFVASLLGVIELRQENLLLASAGAMALGLIFVTLSLVLRTKEAQEARLLDAQFLMAHEELENALTRSGKLEQRLKDAGIERSRYEA